MNGRMLSLLSCCTLLFSATAVSAETRDEKVRKDRAELADDPVWKYNDLEAGIAEAKRKGKPLFVVLRCIP